MVITYQVNCLTFGIDGAELQVLLFKRTTPQGNTEDAYDRYLSIRKSLEYSTIIYLDNSID